MTPERKCWCSATETEHFSADYERCLNCGTLISVSSLPDESYQVSNDNADFYGKSYWLEHQGKDLGYPNIFVRTQTDLTDRNISWLRTLLKYKAPPAKVLELGCSHGSFVALLQMAGYEASGMEMSPWVVDYAKTTFDIPVVLGPIEAMELESGSFDVVVLMDVLEHLPSPKQTIERALDLLKPDGIAVVQMPLFPGVRTFDELQASHPSFVKMLQPTEHLYLYTRESALRLFSELGAPYLTFESPVFFQHDMFFIASRTPVVQLVDTAAASGPLATPKGRFVQALLDQSASIKSLEETVKIIDDDRAGRLDQIHILTKADHDLQEALRDRDAHIKTLNETIKTIDEDRAARLDQIQSLTKMVNDLQAAAAEPTTK